jgi:thymidylate synthase (FAD)
MYRELNGEFGTITKEAVERASKYIVLTGDNNTDYSSIVSLELLRKNIANNKNDIAKYSLPESYKTSLIWTINARSLRNLLELRLSSKALKEFRELAKELYSQLPEPHKILFDDIVEQNRGETDTKSL